MDPDQQAKKIKKSLDFTFSFLQDWKTPIKGI
jgi:hypothetical protein